MKEREELRPRGVAPWWRRRSATPRARSGRLLCRLGASAALVFACAGSLAVSTAPAASAAPVGTTGTTAQASQTIVGSWDFNGGQQGWRGFQERSAGCWLRGGTCPKIDTVYEQAGGQDGTTDGYLRFAGNSAAVYPLPWGQGAYTQWQSPLFTYHADGVKSWTLSFDWRSSHVSYALGWNGIEAEIRNAQNQVVRTIPGLISVPTDTWSHYDWPFDGRYMKDGEQYRITFVAVDYYGPSAATLGHHDIDNVKLTTGDQPQAMPYVKCFASHDLGSGLQAALKGVTRLNPDLCHLTEPAGDIVAPLQQVVDKIASIPGVKELLDRGDGAFTVLDVAAGQAAGWAVGRETLPSTDPRRLFVWFDGGNVGHAGNFAVVFAVNQPKHVIKQVLGNPDGIGGAVTGVLRGQLGAASEVLSDPVGEVLDVDAGWTLDNVKWHLKEVLSGSELPKDAIPSPDTGESGVPQLPLPVPVPLHN